ncbi:metal-dependent transcriptional regulator [Corynebacterium uberis]|uniref:metal-dependent transcriptional regulator n=1 Tax=Corynebacterium uberis TaxID=2883169 RepID=UPI001D0BC41F|nr:metal-dependent transcriptional regulator [Corynebacterium uberis]UDL74653.1 metal-dependent transcriptional regulator [Corynebacterium uberis]UDL76513.1 metal-dependent transcriptional regulator [Corynebacterium uberis]UDL78725.1 metal-dependent transcriptional regulator [Corynebacterium uberis]UDL81004.1 metal-dependent transcriptional regulator [Corynebacterium uberis]UDL83143.1 metal-dependent transcriptional regulator [Corynebacterium uberis]
MHITDLPVRSQDYLKKIYDRQEWGGGAALSDLAAALGQRRSTASEAIKRLAGDGLVNHEPYGDITLTDQGRDLAVALVRRHRLIETFLVTHLGYPVEEIHDEAEVLEHSVSDTFIARLDAVLGHPLRDPHGDPIPDAEGRIADTPTQPLSTATSGMTTTVIRIRDQDPDLLRYLDANGVRPGVSITLLDRPYPDMAQLRTADATITVAANALDSILVAAEN